MQYDGSVVLLCTWYFVWAPDPQGHRNGCGHFLLYNYKSSRDTLFSKIELANLKKKLMLCISNRHLIYLISAKRFLISTRSWRWKAKNVYFLKKEITLFLFFILWYQKSFLQKSIIFNVCNLFITSVFKNCSIYILKKSL